MLYGVLHPYKYSVEITYRAFSPIIKFLEQGWDLKAGAVVPMKVKLRHMEKTVVGLFLATAANKARLDSSTQVLVGNPPELSDAQRLGLEFVLALKALLYSYCPALPALGVFVRECNWNGCSLNSCAAAKECIGMSTVLMMNIIPSEKWLSTEYLGTNTAVSNCDTVAPIQWDRVCEDLADGFPVDCTGRRYVEQEEEAAQPEEEDGESPKRPPPPKATGKQGDGTPAKAKKSKAGASPSQQSPKPGAKPPPNKALGTFAAHFTPSQQTQNGRDATGSANSEMPGDQAEQANGGQFPGKGAKPKAPGLRKRR